MAKTIGVSAKKATHKPVGKKKHTPTLHHKVLKAAGPKRTITFELQLSTNFTGGGMTPVQCIGLAPINCLYVITNSGSPTSAYVGVAQNAVHRFAPRLEALRECGIGPGEVAKTRVMIFKVRLNGTLKNIGQYGDVGATDVEHLLIRSFMNCGGWNVRNIQKTTPFMTVAIAGSLRVEWNSNGCPWYGPVALKDAHLDLAGGGVL